VNSWRKFRRLSGFERQLFIQSLLLLPLSGLALRLISFKRLQSFLTRLAPANQSSNEMAQHARITNAVVQAAARHGVYSATCLPQSLTLWWLLKRQGIESDLRFGARKEAGRMEAHAWVELSGIPLNETLDVEQRFKPFEHAVILTRENS
jgi:transglutaminase superfamily protein